MFLTNAAVVFVAAIGCNIYDTYMTEKGLKAGVAVESFSWLVGTKPTALALSLRDWPIIAFTCVPALVVSHFGNPGLAYGLLAAPAAVGAKHIQGGLEWRTLLQKK